MSEATASHRVDLEPSVTVRYLDGSMKGLGIRQVLADAHLISDLSTKTPFGFVGWRCVLTALAYRVTGLDADLPLSAWRKLRNESLRARRFSEESITDYFDKWSHRFDLFDADRPWLQTASIGEKTGTARSPIHALFPNIPSGNNAQFGSPYMDDLETSSSVPDAIEGLMFKLYFGAGGLTGSRKFTIGSPESATKVSPQQGPLRNKNVYVPVARDLFTSLILTLVPPASVSEH